jgi:cytochrome P450
MVTAVTGPQMAPRGAYHQSQEAEVNRRVNGYHTRTVGGVCAILGVPEQDRNLFARWAVGEDPDALDAYVDVMIADRCCRLTDDVLSELISTGVAGEDLTADEIRVAVRAMLVLAHRAETATPRT